MDNNTATLLAAFIAAGVSLLSLIATSATAVYSVIVTKRGNKENLASNEKLARDVQDAENKRIKSQIDANIVWSARVEWIQNVRKITAEFISACYRYIQTDIDNHVEQLENLAIVQEKKLLLSLYFGHDTKDDIASSEILLNKETNDRKNNSVIGLIDHIYDLLKRHFDNVRELKICSSGLAECAQCENEKDIKQFKCNKGEDEPFTEKDCNELKKKLHNTENEVHQKIEYSFKQIILLTETIRIYLKIEWNKAKNRKSDLL